MTIKRLKAYMQHCLNPLHLYCWLRRMRFRKGISLGIARAYEKYLFPFWPLGGPSKGGLPPHQLELLVAALEVYGSKARRQGQELDRGGRHPK